VALRGPSKALTHHKFQKISKNFPTFNYHVKMSDIPLLKEPKDRSEGK
jgi:Na+-transporting NADH:ubiquinone oxidoreductase subunit NqrF